MKFNEFKREKSAEELQVISMSNEIHAMYKQGLQHSPECKALLHKRDSLEYKLHRARMLGSNNKGVSMTTTSNTTALEIARIAKKAKYVQQLIAEGYDGEELMAMDLSTLRSMVDALETHVIVETYCNPNGTVSRRVTERKAA